MKSHKSCIRSRSVQSEQELWVGDAERHPQEMVGTFEQRDCWLLPGVADRQESCGRPQGQD